MWYNIISSLEKYLPMGKKERLKKMENVKTPVAISKKSQKSKPAKPQKAETYVSKYYKKTKKELLKAIKKAELGTIIRVNVVANRVYLYWENRRYEILKIHLKKIIQWIARKNKRSFYTKWRFVKNGKNRYTVQLVQRF